MLMIGSYSPGFVPVSNIAGTQTVNGVLTAAGGLLSSTSSTFVTGLNSIGNIVGASNLRISGGATIVGALQLGGGATITGSINGASNLAILGGATIVGNLQLGGGATFVGLAVAKAGFASSPASDNGTSTPRTNLATATGGVVLWGSASLLIQAGVAGVPGQRFWILNRTGYTLTIGHNVGTTGAPIWCPGAANFGVVTGGAVELIYDGITSSSWYVLSNN